LCAGPQREPKIDTTQRLFYRQAFKIEFLRSTATQFQELFAELMHRRHRDDFQKVRPYGRKGDLKCDGYLSSAKTVFQCYAPRELKETWTLKKMDEDYPGAKAIGLAISKRQVVRRETDRE